ncbi:MAG: hypothetical protein WB988_20375 [Candidatus Nitrosopolaris sp.]
MAEIVVNKGELKDIRDNIDKLLRLGKENVTRRKQYASDEPKELTERQKKILTYVKNNPGTTKESITKKRVIDNLDLGSRMTVHKAINGLIEDDLLIVKPDDSNQHIQHLYFNHENVVNSLLHDFEFLKQTYFRLIEETTKKFKPLYQTHTKYPERYIMALELLDTLLIPYKHLIIMYFMFDLLLQQEQPLDKNILYSRFAIVYGNMTEIHTKINEYITPIIVNSLDRDSNREPLKSSLYSIEAPLSYENIKEYLACYEMYRLSAFAEPVLDILWKITYPVLPNMDPVYAYGDRKILTDWRNIISGDKDTSYEPKTTQVQNLGESNKIINRFC